MDRLEQSPLMNGSYPVASPMSLKSCFVKKNQSRFPASPRFAIASPFVSPRSVRNPCSPFADTPSVMFYPNCSYDSDNQVNEDLSSNYLSPLSGDTSESVLKSSSNWADALDDEESNILTPVKCGRELIHRLAIGKVLAPENTDTTLMVRNIPNCFTREQMMDEIKRRNVHHGIDFFYLPGEPRNLRNVGFCFVNFETPAAAEMFKAAMTDVYFPENGKKCAVHSGKVQGQKANIEAYYKTAGGKVGTLYQPCIFKDGLLIPLPPTKFASEDHSVTHTLPDWIDEREEFTLMLRNIPNMYNRDMLKADMEERKVLHYVDFLYLPTDMRHQRSIGYAFINVKKEGIEKFVAAFDKRRLEKVISEKRCEISLASVQGLEANLRTYKDSANMCLHERFHPVLFKNGIQHSFPASNLSRRELRRISRDKSNSARVMKRQTNDARRSNKEKTILLSLGLQF